jgi:hypothetical protein
MMRPRPKRPAEPRAAPARSPRHTPERAPTGIAALQTQVGNQGLGRMVGRTAAGGPRVLQREITIAGKAHTAADAYEFSTELRRALGARGYSVPARLLKIVQTALGRKDIDLKTEDDRIAAQKLASEAFSSWDSFVDCLAENEYVQARLPSKQPRKRARKLGKRPDWTSEIAKRRPPPEKGVSFAARHVIPSHFLGYAVEQWSANAEQIQAWVAQAKKIRPALVDAIPPPTHPSKLALKRYVWQILHNHLGNLWWGPSPDNTTIGFFAPYAEDLLEKLRAAAAEGKLDKALVAKLVGELPEFAGTSALAKRWNEIRTDLRWIGASDDPTAVLAAAEDAFECVDEALEEAEDVFFQLELDPTQPKHWPEARAAMQSLENIDAAGTQFLAFLSKDWPGTLGAS